MEAEAAVKEGAGAGTAVERETAGPLLVAASALLVAAAAGVGAEAEEVLEAMVVEVSAGPAGLKTVEVAARVTRGRERMRHALPAVFLGNIRRGRVRLLRG